MRKIFFKKFYIESFICVVLMTLCVNVNMIYADYYTNSGTQTLETQSDFYPTTMTRYVVPGFSIVFRIDKIEEMDTKYISGGMCGGVSESPVEDSQSQGRIRKYGGTVSGDFEKSFSGTGYIDPYIVPSTATNGQTIYLTAEIHDTRNSSDSRHDDWSEILTWEFIVSTACPTLSVYDVIDQDPSRPIIGESYGKYVAVMLAGGNPYPRDNWDGTTLTEELGTLTCNDTEEFIEGSNGKVIEGGDTFTIGTGNPSYSNVFYDWHQLYASGIILRTGVNNAVATHSQDYICKPDPSGIKSSFTVTFTCTNLDPGGANERVKCVVTK